MPVSFDRRIAGAFLDRGGAVFNAKHPDFGARGDGVTDDTAAVAAAVSTASDGDTILFPPGRYCLSGIDLGGRQLHLRGYGATIVQTAKTVVFEWAGTWGTVNAISSITIDDIDVGGVAHPASVLTLSGAPVDIEAGDVVRVYSEDTIPQSVFASRKLGEFATVYQVDGNDVWLNGPLRDIYTTTPRVARIDPRTVSFAGFEFEIDSSIDNGPGSGGGLDAPIRIIAATRPSVVDVTLRRTVSNGIVFHSCYGYTARNIEARGLPDESDSEITRFGYGIVDANSEHGVVDGCFFIECRHGFTTNTYAHATATDPHYYGRSAYTRVSNCHAVGGAAAGFDTHDEAYGITFSNCTHTRVAHRKQATSGARRAGFQSRSEATTFINCEAHYCTFGFSIFTSPERSGGNTPDNWIKETTLIGCKVVQPARTAIQVARANVSMHGCVIEDSALNPSNFVISLTDATLRVTGGLFTLRNPNPFARVFGLFGSIDASRLVVQGAHIDMSPLALNGSSELENYNARLVVTEDAGAHFVTLRDLTVDAGDKPISALVHHYSSTGANQNSFADVSNIQVRTSGDSIACADSNNRDAGLAAFFSNYPSDGARARYITQIDSDSVALSITTENNGTATLANGNTSVAVTHGLGVTPALEDIIVRPIEAWGSMTQFWISSPTSTQFTINVDQNPTQDVGFAWTASVQ
jgi:hypothetical protein